MLTGSIQDPRIQRLPCTHSGTYADDCLCDRVRQHKCYIVATCDRDLRRRIRKVVVVVQSATTLRILHTEFLGRFFLLNVHLCLPMC